MSIPLTDLYYGTPWDNNFKYMRLDPCICNGEIIDFSVPSLSNEQMREILGLNINKNTKETKKMEAKKCDRCGKLYENPVNGENCGAEVRFRYLPVDGEENLSEKKIIEKQTKNIYISSLSIDVDICPDCRESFKRWFENG